MTSYKFCLDTSLIIHVRSADYSNKMEFCFRINGHFHLRESTRLWFFYCACTIRWYSKVFLIALPTSHVPSQVFLVIFLFIIWSRVPAHHIAVNKAFSLNSRQIYHSIFSSQVTRLIILPNMQLGLTIPLDPEGMRSLNYLISLPLVL